MPITWGDVFEEVTADMVAAPITRAEFCAAMFNNLRTAVRESGALTFDEMFERQTSFIAA